MNTAHETAARRQCRTNCGAEYRTNCRAEYAAECGERSGAESRDFPDQDSPVPVPALSPAPALSRRLALLAELLPTSESLADIGTDHAALLTALVKAGKIQKGVGVEIAEGPYRRALSNVKARGLEDKIEIRRGDGLTPLLPGEVKACAIAGMGGGSILAILEKSPGVVSALDYLLLQPMTQAAKVRHYLQQNHWRIGKEALVEERGILYQIVLALPGEMKPLTPAEAELGPLLLAEKPPLLTPAAEQKLLRLRRAAAGLHKSDSVAGYQKKIRLHEQINEWEALLQCLTPAGKYADGLTDLPRRD